MELQIGSVIAHTRHAKDMTQEALAAAVGVSAAAVSKWETGASYPDITLLSPIARALGLTIDRLLDYREQPTGDEIKAFSERLSAMFETEGYHAGQDACEALLREYPSCGDLKVAVAGLYFHYISLALAGQADADMLDRITARCLTLYEQGEQESTLSEAKPLLRVMRMQALILVGRYNEAEALLPTLPKRTPVDPDKIAVSLYLAQDRLDEAAQFSRRLLLSHINESQMELMNLSAAARRKGDFESTHRLCDAYCALSELFGLDKSTGLQLQMMLAVNENEIDRALDLFDAYVDARLCCTLDYTDNPFFTGVQTNRPSAAELSALNQICLRVAEKEEDPTFAPLRKEPRFQAALNRFRTALNNT